jgi:hypothetical protein
MKIYYFDKETGAYQGEGFADESPLKRGAYIVPSEATTIASPAFEQGEIPVFNRLEQRWEIRTASALCLKQIHGLIDGSKQSEDSL